MHTVPPLRIRQVNQAPVQPGGDYVLYWMTAFRRVRSNFSLQRALEHCRELNKPLLILEALRTRYHWASDRLHRFVIEGMAANQQAIAAAANPGVYYFPYVEPAHGEGSGLLATLAKRAAVVVTDDFPCFFLPRLVKVAGRQLPVRLEAVDSNGIVPLRGTDHAFTMAFHFRRWLQKNLPRWLEKSEFPLADPLKRCELPTFEKLPASITKEWRPADLAKLLAPGGLQALPIDHSVLPASIHGGSAVAETVLKEFLKHRLARYADERNQPDANAASGVSPYLHFGHLSVHEMFTAAVRQEDWSLDCLAKKADGKNSGWWGTSPPLESFLDELITWREIGFNFCTHRPDDYDQYESLPEWCRKSLAKHAKDARPNLYDLDQFESAATHDPLWNAAQRQLVREGRMHNYLRMLWGKKVLEWSASPEDALQTLIHLNNKYAVDGRNPNSYSGIFWCLGRYDRPWAPERPIFGMIRYMSSENTARKIKVKNYLREYSEYSE
ncbi:deoxyribodipyrimidine photolyase [Anatilimnocola aggregata]|uniref:Deoxyribodipyrimidine photo-lyase n=1 Tax=Anatilimnocola aggregata TaxID=2528021 RepID=A0A517YDI9_9BACT|nr:FAD-binding domain-containing protein [Anatilimnocola aggregata]QDU28259.1 deoxyribodipyrimidine photolyase [Anatilimnocola aggregata]